MILQITYELELEDAWGFSSGCFEEVEMKNVTHRCCKWKELTSNCFLLVCRTVRT